MHLSAHVIFHASCVINNTLVGKSMNKRMKTINTFEFTPIHVDENVNCIISITG